MLEGDGYHVIEAEKWRDGCHTPQRRSHHPCAHGQLQTPELAGEEMVRQLREKRPDLRAWTLQGTSIGCLAKRPVLREGEAFVEKPFTSKELLEAISLLPVR